VLLRGIDRLCAAAGAIAAWSLVPMIGLAVAAALTAVTDRHLGTSWSSNALIEGQWYLFAVVFMLGAPLALAKGAHVRVDALFGRFGPRARHWIDLVGGVLFLLPFAAFGFYESLDFVERSWSIREGSPDPGGLPRYPIKTLIPIAFGLLFLQGLSQVIKHGAALVGLPEEQLGLPPSHTDHLDGEFAG
jgi:TRAP-type mannitol/chloroaromatic compound transport system permease small subunit